MIPVATHRGIVIFEDFGYYYPSTDTNVEGGSIETIIEYIDGILMNFTFKRKYKLDSSIISDYIQR